jgi:heat shock protein HtpX
MRAGRVLALDQAELARQAASNRRQTVLLLAGLSALAGLTGLVLGGVPGLVGAAVAALLLLLFDPEPGGALFRHLFGGVRLSPHVAPDLCALARALAARAGLPRSPELYLLPDRRLQAMATGTPERSAVAVTLGLLRALPPREVAAVLAHEIAHIRHRDTRVMRIAASAASLTRTMAGLGAVLLLLSLPALLAGEVLVHPLALLLLWFGPMAADLLALSVSRRREFLADAGAVELTGDPDGLAAALARLERLQGDDWERLAGGNGPRWLRLFRTHPTIAERIGRLAEMRRAPALAWPERLAWGGDPRRNPWQAAVRRWRM